ncbi:peptidoglycan-recognition protein SC2-like [Mizuhopecten yessoensis]|uniref:peptidoglycan-recognition protein SC2-like n=1 Tax=Mizuhopecten yessoensis TaxID=6573 RepID=UPI000B45C614|nr:peptidoglycan-recognition protein SC2-like [Mizuhopecten yessoensis]
MSLLILIAVASLHIVVGSDTACMNHGGHCQDESTSCSGNYVSNLCSGSASRRCCLPSASSGQCSDIGGKCQDDHLYCTGSYVTGKCSGDATNRCCTSHHIGGTDQSICDNIKVISRDTWGATRPTHVTTLNHPVHLFFVHHTEGRTCHNEAECASVLKGVQNYHMNSRGYSDIGYSFLIGQDGRVYEGRGWGVVGAHTLHYNSLAYAVSFMGNFMNSLPPASALNAAKALAQCGVSKGHIQSGYSLFGHRDVGNTDCPGDQLYAEIRTWGRYNITHSSTIH